MALSIPVSEIQEKAATFRPARFLLTVLALPFFLIGCLAAVVWVAVSWVGAAVAVGFVTVRDRSRGDDGAA